MNIHVMELRAQDLVASQHHITGCHLQWGEEPLGNSRIDQHLEGIGGRMLLNLLLPLMEDGLGAYDEGRLAVDRLEGGEGYIYICRKVPRVRTEY